MTRNTGLKYDNYGVTIVYIFATRNLDFHKKLCYVFGIDFNYWLLSSFLCLSKIEGLDCYGLDHTSMFLYSMLLGKHKNMSEKDYLSMIIIIRS